jgi:hypothetical protein
MRSLRVIAPVAIGAALVGLAVAPRVAPSSAGADPIASDGGPVAHAAGGDAGPPPLPSIVNVRVVRAEAALASATASVDQGQPAQAIVALNSVRTNMAKAWTAARFVIETTPPPPPAAEGGVRAEASGGAVAGAIATPEDTAFGVLTLQHDVVTTTTGLADTRDATLAAGVNRTLITALKARNKAIAYIHSIAPPPPPVADEGRVHADASGAAVVAGWDTVMPGVVPHLDDEIQQTAGTRAMAPKSLLNLQKIGQAEAKTRTVVNQFWPPLPPGD